MQWGKARGPALFWLEDATSQTDERRVESGLPARLPLSDSKVREERSYRVARLATIDLEHAPRVRGLEAFGAGVLAYLWWQYGSRSWPLLAIVPLLAFALWGESRIRKGALQLPLWGLFHSQAKRSEACRERLLAEEPHRGDG